MGVGIGTDTPTEALEVNGRVIDEGAFAEIYVADGSTAQSIATGATYTKLDGFATDGVQRNATAASATDKITITNTGIYKVTASINGSSGGANITFKYSVFLNGVEQDQCHSHRKYAGAGDNGSSAITCFIDSTTADWDIDLRARHDDGGAVNFTPTYMTLDLNYLGET